MYLEFLHKAAVTFQTSSWNIPSAWVTIPAELKGTYLTWTSVFTPEIWPMAAAMLLMLLLAGYSWRHRSMPGALPFMVGCLFSVLATIGILIANLTADPGLRDFWLRFQSAWLLPAVTAITCFVLEYAWPGRWLTRRSLVLLSLLPLFSIFYFLGGHVFFAPAPSQSGVASISQYTPAGMVLMAYSVAMTFVNLSVFAWLFIRSPQHHWPVVLMASSAVFITAVMLREYLPPGNQISSRPLFILPFLGYAIALYAFRIFDPISLARRTAIDQLNAGLIVLDPQGRVVSLNPAAEKILGKTTGEAKGRLVREWLPAYPDLTLANPGVVEIEFSQGTGPEQRHITLVSSRLADFRELPVGRLLMLRDVTEQRRAQAQIVEQQRALATQDERERMARELHDSLGQVLSYASFQVGSAAKLARDGQGASAANQLDRLGEIIRDAHADLREHILNLRSTAALAQPFFPVVRQYLEGYATSYEMTNRLEVDPALEENSFAPELQLQLFRILQEALSNARKHGRARQVEVTFTKADSYLHLSIQDDGCGFDPDLVLSSKAPHYGLQFMRERAEQMKGSLQVQSAPGSGTGVLLTIPYKE